MSSSGWIGKNLGGRYQIEELLGQGGMSAVYRAVDPNLNRAVAVKLIHPHLADAEEFVSRFREEANMVAQLRHPNIVQVFDFNRDGDDFYMVMEYVPGETLRERLERQRQRGAMLPLVKAMAFAVNICDAADYAHRRNLIHRDIKPANVVLDTQEQAILMDFGIAKIVGGPQYTATGATIGTAMYMSPEQIRGEGVDGRTDIYAIGVMLFEMICGRPPFMAESPMTLLMMHISDPVPDISGLRAECPAALKEVVEKAMAKDRDGRYQHAAEMSSDLRRIATGLQAELQAPTAARPAARDAAALAATMPPRASQPAAGSTATAAESSGTRTAGGGAGEIEGAEAAPPAYTPPERVAQRKFGGKWLIGGGLLVFGAFIVIAAGLLALYLLTRPDGDGGGALAEVAQTETALAILAAAATETPTSAPTATDTVAPTEPAAPTATPALSPTPAPRRVGLMSFVDNEVARAGTLELTSAEAGAPAAGSHYELWLSDGQDAVFLGPIEPGSGISFSGDTDENLLSLYDRAFITVEEDGSEGSSPDAEPIFSGFVLPESLEQIRLLIAAAPDTPEQEGYLVGAQDQALLAIDHGGFLAEALAASDMATARIHAEHVTNILAGEENSAFGDLDGSGLAENPGDGYGLIAYFEHAGESAREAVAADGASDEVKLHAGHVITVSENALTFVDEAIRAAGRVLASDTVAEAEAAAQSLGAFLEAILNGIDADGDSVIEPTPGEGGLLIAYEHALKMGSFEFFIAQDAGFGPG